MSGSVDHPHEHKASDLPDPVGRPAAPQREDDPRTDRRAGGQGRGDGQGDVFGAASRAVLDYLVEHVPMQFWAVSRLVGGRQVYLTVNDNPLGLHVGDGPAWRESLCQVMYDDGGPRIAPAVDHVPTYRDRLKDITLPVGAYIGIPLIDARGELFGTVCGVDTHPNPPS